MSKPKRQRDFKAEHAARKAKGAARGFSVSQSRGHPKPSEKHIAPKRVRKVNQAHLQAAVNDLAQGLSLKQAARRSNIPADKLRRYIHEKKIAKWQGRKWKISPKIKRHVRIFTEGMQKHIEVRNQRTLTAIGKYNAAIRRLRYNFDETALKPFRGRRVRDMHGQSYVLDTDLNTILMILATRSSQGEEFYRYELPVW